MKNKNTLNPEVEISQKGRRWLSGGHMWCFESDVTKIKNCKDGDVVRVVSGNACFEAFAFYSSKSKIALRILSRNPNKMIDDGFFRSRILSAITRRGEYKKGVEARRILFAESDFLPGLIIDDYAGYMVVQSMTAGVDRILDIVVKTLSELDWVKGILLRLDASGRTKEKLAIEKKVVFGDVPRRIEVEIFDGRRVYVDCFDGHKTGIYLDQRVNWSKAALLSRGAVLDVFSYQGNFSVAAAAGADEVLGIDMSPEAEKFFDDNMKLNGIKNVSFLNENAFDALRAFDGERREFDTIILDPPSFARDKRSLDGALRGFKEINLRAMKLLRPGGRLLTYSCSHALTRELFIGLLKDAAGDCRRDFIVKEEFYQAPDHPVVLAMPETAYLRGFCLERV